MKLTYYIAKRTCNLCGVMMEGGIPGFLAHGEEHHPGHYLGGLPCSTEGKIPRTLFAPKNYWCPLDDKWYSSRRHLARAITRSGWSNERYFNEHGQAFMPVEWAENKLDEKYGDGYGKPECLECNVACAFNQQKWHYPAFCSFSCSTSWHAKNTDRVARAEATKVQRVAENPDHNLRPNQVRYWILKGHSEEEAKDLVRKRQTTNSLEAFVSRHGEEDGLRRYKDRQERWFSSLKDSGMFSGVSKASRVVFSQVQDRIGRELKFGSDEQSIRGPKTVYKVDCYDRTSNRIIEFFGDYWHGNPKIYAPTDRIKQKNGMSVAEKWEHDRVKIACLEEKGHEVMVIWESDYNADSNACIERCVRFLDSGAK